MLELEQATLRQQFQDLLQHERQAAQMYQRLADAAGDPAMREQALEIQRDKLKHIRLTERLLEIVD